jgi:hypothetical protein
MLQLEFLSPARGRFAEPGGGSNTSLRLSGGGDGAPVDLWLNSASNSGDTLLVQPAVDPHIQEKSD